MRELAQLYGLLGRVLRERYRGWSAAILTGNPPLGRELGLHAKRTHTMFNGALECRLLRFDVEPEYFVEKRAPGALPTFDAAAARARPGAQMFANRLRKNQAALAKWAARESIACYRVYDADMPEYAFSVDLYRSGLEEGSPRWVYVQEYAPPETVDAGESASAPRGGVRRDSRGHGCRAGSRACAHAAPAEGRHAVHEARRKRRVSRGGRRRS